MSNQPDSTNAEGNTLDEALAEEIGGGNCTAQQLIDVTSGLIQAYENVVDFTSHVIERVMIK